jgi:hypothetical protein
VLGGRHHVAVGTEDVFVEAAEPGRQLATGDLRQSSGLNPTTRLTPPIVVLGSRSAEIVRTSSAPLLSSLTLNSK